MDYKKCQASDARLQLTSVCDLQLSNWRVDATLWSLWTIFWHTLFTNLSLSLCQRNPHKSEMRPEAWRCLRWTKHLVTTRVSRFFRLNHGMVIIDILKLHDQTDGGCDPHQASFHQQKRRRFFSSLSHHSEAASGVLESRTSGRTGDREKHWVWTSATPK